jgi:hypothetical protein
MPNSLRVWFFLLMEKWLSTQPDYYCNRIPATTLDTMPVIKNYIYWDTVANILQNKPFMNELEEKQEKLKSSIDRELLKKEDNLNKFKSLRSELKGVESIDGLLRDANDKAIKERNS